ncbi:GGDEF domain-containing protein [Motilimonas eburnea]|uniref:GGDEF domain-containing protein n=1 Tax=Motilimonas eburnea TaxID=1737488 RepID=UPI001E31EB5A|nr:GGDEF domain-containing protein [Motilimonas eburnea]MCE2572037.1 GGDEF domain-containing protein [Motilimonas eburnea]
MLQWIERQLIRLSLLEPQATVDESIQYDLNIRVCLLLATCVLVVTLLRPFVADLPKFFLIAGYVNSVLLFALWWALRRGWWLAHSASLVLGLCMLMLVPMQLVSGGANSHYSPLIPLFPLFAVLMGSAGLAVLTTMLWVVVWFVFYFYGVSDLDLTVSNWSEGKTASRTLWLILSSLIILIITISFENRQRRLQHSLLRLGLTDPLTQVANRRAMEQELAQQALLCERTGVVFSVMMIDVDHFKKFNDLQGHDGGDEALKQVATCLTQLAREGQDSVFRYGGEEFTVILRHTSASDAFKVAQKYRQGIKALNLKYQAEQPDVLTITIGLTDSHQGTDPAGLLKLADQALYQGKQQGRDCVVNAAPQRHVNHASVSVQESTDIDP